MHPVVFQLYKSTMVFLTGFLFLIPRAIDPTLGPVSSQKQEYGELPLYIFTYWGIVSAAGWIPSGLTTIFAVPIVGVGLAVAVAAGSSSILSFLVFWLVMGEKVKTHSCGDGCTYYLAPVWLFLVVCGMVGMVLSPQFKNLPQWLGGGARRRAAAIPRRTICPHCWCRPRIGSTRKRKSPSPTPGRTPNRIRQYGSLGYLLA